MSVDKLESKISKLRDMLQAFPYNFNFIQPMYHVK